MVGGFGDFDGDFAECEPGRGYAEGDEREQVRGDGCEKRAGKRLVGWFEIADEVDRVQPDKRESGPAEESVRGLVGVVVGGAEPGEREENNGDEKKVDEIGEHEKCLGGFVVMVGCVEDCGGDGEKNEPDGGGDGAAGVQAAEVIDLCERPAKGQGEMGGGEGGEGEEKVDEALLTDENGDGDVGDDEIAQRGEVVVPAESYADGEEREIDKRYETDESAMSGETRKRPGSSEAGALFRERVDGGVERRAAFLDVLQGDGGGRGLEVDDGEVGGCGGRGGCG